MTEEMLGLPMFSVTEEGFDTTEFHGQYIHVDVLGRGTVVIKAEDDGIVVDIYPFHVVDEPVATTWAHMNDLIEPENAE